jgi:hypothetical protein
MSPKAVGDDLASLDQCENKFRLARLATRESFEPGMSEIEFLTHPVQMNGTGSLKNTVRGQSRHVQSKKYCSCSFNKNYHLMTGLDQW